MKVDFWNVFYLKIEENSRREFCNDRAYYCVALFKTDLTIEYENGITAKIEPGDIVIIPPNTHHACLCEKGSYTHMSVLFFADDEFMKRLDLPYLYPIKLNDTDIISNAVFRISQQNISDSPVKKEMMNAYITEILGTIHEQTHSIESSYGVKKGEDLQTVRMTVMESPGIKWTLEKMAAMANMSKRNFTRKYKQLYGKSPIADLDDIRFLKAKRLLDTGYSINHIMFSCGFKSQQYFSLFFKKRAGITPSEYMKQSKTRSKYLK